MFPLTPIPPDVSQPSPPDGPTSNPIEVKERMQSSIPPQPSETVSISQTGQELSQYTEALNELPDIREERVAQIQKALEQGTYSVSSHDLADKLIQDLSTDIPSSSIPPS